MAVLAFGINHNTAPLAIRERVAFTPDQLAAALTAARQLAGVNEVAILSTCNRTELYLEGEVAPAALLQWLASYHHLEPDALAPSHYLYTDAEAVRHMMRVACGLDSLVLGEPQILGQMKSAYAQAQEAATVAAQLHGAFQQVFAVAKRVRSETAIGENPVSVAYAAVALAQQIFSDLKQSTALLVGAGETIELVARHLREQGVQSLLVANRTLARAQHLAEDFAAEPLLLSDIPSQLHRADIVISSTASQLPLLGKGAVESALKKRKHRPMFLVDIAVPRDIEPEVGELDDAYLYTVDDLREVIEENRKSRQEAAAKADHIVAEGVADYLKQRRLLDVVGTLTQFRERAEQVRDAEVQRAQRLLAKGETPEQVVQQLARNLTNKLMHQPTTRLRQAGSEGRADIIALIRELYDLPGAGDDETP